MNENAAIAVMVSAICFMLAVVFGGLAHKKPDPIAERLEAIRQTISLGEEAKERLMMEALKGSTNLPPAEVEE